MDYRSRSKLLLRYLKGGLIPANSVKFEPTPQEIQSWGSDFKNLPLQQKDACSRAKHISKNVYRKTSMITGCITYYKTEDDSDDSNDDN